MAGDDKPDAVNADDKEAEIDPGDAAGADEVSLGVATGSDKAEIAPYDPEPVRDRYRGGIAISLVAVLGFTVAVSLFLVYAAPWHVDKLVTVLQIIFGPVTTLVGAATGYYFGAASGNQKK